MNAGRISDQDLVLMVRDAARPLVGSPADYDTLLDLVGDAEVVCLGEATHGTHEFYSARAEITMRLIREKGFTAVVAEADWPDAYRINRYVHNETSKMRPGQGEKDQEPVEALGDFKRFPLWMWRNQDIIDLITRLRDYNQEQPDATKKAGFYGMDLYSLYTSVEAVIRILERIDPPAAQRAKERYACFDHFGGDPQRYGYATAAGWIDSCEQEVVNQLVEMSRDLRRFVGGGETMAADEAFIAEQNARLVKNAEEYYRSMYRGRASSWNQRDSHMVETLEALTAHLNRRNMAPKIVVWAHNSHLGDARATEMSLRGEFNVGQLVRERWRERARLIGFTTNSGTVAAASGWDEPVEIKRIRPGLQGSYENLFHETGLGRFLLILRGETPTTVALREPLLERAIGVIYLPETERISHYFHASLAQQFDAVFHFDVTRAVAPLDHVAGVEEPMDLPDTYPSAV